MPANLALENSPFWGEWKKSPRQYPLCHLTPHSGLQTDLSGSGAPGRRPRPGLPNTDIIQPVGTFHSGHLHPLPGQSPGVSPGPGWRRGGRALEVHPGLAQRGRYLPGCVSRPNQLPFLPAVSRDTGVEGNVTRECFPWGRGIRRFGRSGKRRS